MQREEVASGLLPAKETADLSILGTLSYPVTTLGFPATIYVFFYDQRQQRKAEIAEMHPALLLEV